MVNAGIDIGSRTVKVIAVENGDIVYSRVAASSFDPLAVCRDLLDGLEYDTITATGYGRHMFREYFDCQVISEITAFGRGARALFPECGNILDIGGQDTKAITLDDAGNLRKFEMNDKCAAGTGRFLEIMAAALGYSMDDFIKAALTADKPEKINNMCTVFAESEVVSLTAKGAKRSEVALGIHRSIAKRSVAMLKRIANGGDTVFAGGVALNKCMRKLIEMEIGRNLYIPPNPQTVGALGCALNGTVLTRMVS